MTTFLTGLVAGMFLLLLGQRITNAYRKRDDREAVIRDVAEKYHATRSDHIAWLLPSGICRLKTDNEIERSVVHMQELGESDPLRHIRGDLHGKRLCDFFRILNEDKKPLVSKDVKKAIQEAKVK